jgi:hypothetical protein
MAAKAAADSGASFRVAARTSDQRVSGKTRGASLDEVWLLMEKSCQVRITRNGAIVTEEVRKNWERRRLTGEFQQAARRRDASAPGKKRANALVDLGSYHRNWKSRETRED